MDVYVSLPVYTVLYLEQIYEWLSHEVIHSICSIKVIPCMLVELNHKPVLNVIIIHSNVVIYNVIHHMWNYMYCT